MLVRNIGSATLVIFLGVAPSIGCADQPVDATIAAARQAALDDRNAKAAQLFLTAVSEAPERRLQLLPELSNQLTYAGRGSQAIPLYQEVIASRTLSATDQRQAELGLALALSWNHKLPASLATYNSLLTNNPRDIEALLGRARVLSWQDQLSSSLREYDRILVLDPTNIEARENIARVQSWQGRQRSARRSASAIRATHPDDRQAFATLAQSELWLGRPDVAAADVRAMLHENPTDSGARGLSADVADALRPTVRVADAVSTQSDGFLIRDGLFESELHAGDGLTTLGVRYRPITYTNQVSSDDTSERRLGLYARRRINDWSEVNLNVNNDGISAIGSPTKNLLLYNSYVTFWPNDTVRFDVGTHRDTFDNVTSLREGISAVFDSVSMDITPDENTRLSLRADRANFSDGNARGWKQVEFERAVVRRPRLSIGARATTYTFKESLYNGYFDPLRYSSAELTTHLYGDSRSRWYYDISGSYGREWVLAGGTRPTHALHGALSYVLSKPLSLSAVYDSFDTRQFSNGGFARTTLGLRIESRW